MRPAAFLFLLLSVSHARPNPQPQNLLSDIASVFGFGDDSTSTSAARTIPPPATASATPSKTQIHVTPQTNSPTPTSSATGRTVLPNTIVSSSSQSTVTPMSSNSNSTITSAPSTTSTSSSSTSTSPPSTTTQAAIQPTQTPAPSSSGGVPPGGAAVAVIMTLFILAGLAWLLFRYHPAIRARWLAHQEKKMQERSYRDAIDGPFAGGGAGVRTAALGHSRRSMLTSFFAPRTVKLGNGQEIRRKPVNWGAGADSVPPMPPLTPDLRGMAMEKVALTNMAAPMARSESVVSCVSDVSRGTVPGGISAMSSVRSSPAVARKGLPPMPPMPPVPIVAELGGLEVPRNKSGTRKDGDKDKAKPRDKDGDPHKILSRKSIFELA